MAYYENLCKLAAKAKGIPDRSEFGKHTKLKPGQTADFVIQEHAAQRAGKHYDLRLGTPGTDLYSWAMRKGLPQPGGKPVLAVRQPLHDYNYKDFEGNIPEGYGAGEVRKASENAVVLQKVSPRSITFTVGDQRGGQRYAMVDTGDGKWLMRNVTPMGSDLLAQYPKPKMKTLSAPASAAEARKLLENSFTSAKLDGALTTLAFTDRGVEAYSPRTSKKTGRPIVYTERLGLVGYKPPKELAGTALKGEVIAMQGNKVLPANEISALMNMNLADMQRRIAEQNIKMRVALFDAPQIPDLQKKMQYLEGISRKLPKQQFMVAPYSFDARDSMKMYDAIKSGVHPLTAEGMVVSPLGSYEPQKLKFRPEFDVTIRDVFPAVTKSGKPRAGGFEYSLPGSRKTVGRVGTGFDHAMLQDMLAHPEEYVGRTARVEALQKYRKGTLRAPSFIALHEDYPQKRSAYTVFASIAAGIIPDNSHD